MSKFNQLFQSIIFQSHSHYTYNKYFKKIPIQIFKNRIIYTDIISEAKLYRKDWFISFYNYLNKNQQQSLIYTCKELLNKCFSQIPEIYSYLVSNLQKKINIQFLNFDNFNQLKNIYKQIVTLYEQQDCKKLFNDLQNCNALFVSFKDMKDQSILFLNRFNFSLDDIRHQFTHFIQWLNYTDDYLDKDKNNLLDMYRVMIMLLLAIDDNELNVLLRPSEFQPCLNNSIDILHKLKQKHNLIIDLFKQQQQSIMNYIKRIASLNYLNDIQKNIGCKIIIIYNILNKRLDEIKDFINQI